MPTNKNILKNSNVNYIGKDFNDLKSSLMRYAKSYFPNTYKDFNETSPGMMLIEMSAYVGDVLNFYIDQQYREMMLPLTEDRRNIINIAKSYGYKIRAVSPAYATLTLKTTVAANEKTGKPDFNDARCITIDKGMQIQSTSDSTQIFETLDIVDFKISSSLDPAPEVVSVDGSTGVPSEYLLKRKVKAVSGETITKTFTIGEPTKFLTLRLPETNVIEILKITDSSGNLWYEVQNLAQDRVSDLHHYTSDSNRDNAYTNADGTTILAPVPYSLSYKKVSKRFTTNVDANNITNINFGNGILKNGNSFSAGFLAVEQQGINLPGGEENLDTEIDPLMGDAYGTLGEAPAHTTLTVTYRKGGGVSANSPSGDLTTVSSIVTLPSGGNISALLVNNETPAAGGTAGETLDDIRYRTMAHIATQNRCVTREDYEARTLNMSAKFGNIAKVYSARAGAIRNAQTEKIIDLVDRLKEVIDLNYQIFDPGTPPGGKLGILNDIKLKLDANKDGGLNPDDFNVLLEALEMAHSNISQDDRLYTVDLYLLSYDNNKKLINTPTLIKQNLKNYLNEFRLITDQVTFYDGYVINFGVVFDVIARKDANKEEVKLACIQRIADYFTIDTMQFKQVLYTSEVENILWDVDGVGAVNYVTITQNFDYNAETGDKGTESSVFNPGLYNTLINSDGSTSTGTNTNYGYYYDFSKFYGKGAVAGRGVILPAYEPAIFELKYPRQDIKGIVR